MFVVREELERFLEGGGRKLLYGRRKTGKTFYARKKLNNWRYFIVETGGKKIFDPDRRMELNAETLLRLLPDMDRVIIDEFHRLKEPLPSIIQSGEAPENLLLITSTLHHYLTSSMRSPLLGMLTEKRVGLISPLDLLRNLKPSNKRAFERAVMYQEPVFVGKSPHEALGEIPGFVPLLVGEILREEDLKIEERISGILEAVSSGKHTLTEIAGHLHAKGLLPSPSAPLVSKYVGLMEKIGLLDRIHVWERERGSIRRVSSPIVDFYYYCAGKYGLGEVSLPVKFLEKVWEEKLPLYVEIFAERYFSELQGLKPVKVLRPEVDIALVEFKRLRVVGEVKWKDRVSRREIREVEERLGRFGEVKKILVVPEADVLTGETELDVWDVDRMVREAEKRGLRE